MGFDIKNHLSNPSDRQKAVGFNPIVIEIFLEV